MMNKLLFLFYSAFQKLNFVEGGRRRYKYQIKLIDSAFIYLYRENELHFGFHKACQWPMVLLNYLGQKHPTVGTQIFRVFCLYFRSGTPITCELFKKTLQLEQRVTGVISLSEFELSKLKVYKVERSIYLSIFRIKQRDQPLYFDLFILREINWKGRVQV